MAIRRHATAAIHVRRALPIALAALALLSFTATALADHGEAGDGKTLSLGPLEFSLHGYFRAPLAFSWRCRNEQMDGSCGEVTDADRMNGNTAQYSLHAPWLVDDDYFRSGFAYTRLQEHDYAELYLGLGNQYVYGEISLQGSLFSDWARPLLENQLGIAQGSLRLRWEKEGPKLKLRAQLRGGAFWDRFGWLESYDTYVFARTHQMGVQGRLDLSLERVDLWALYGFGAHLDNIQANQGLTLLNYLHLGASVRGIGRLGFYFLDNATQDRRQFTEFQDADLRVAGTDVLVDTAPTGRLYLAFSRVSASHAKYLSPAIEVIHSYGGSGLTDNFLGTDSSNNGTGTLYNFAFEGTYSLRRVLELASPAATGFLRGGDVTLRYFGLATWVESDQSKIHNPKLDPALNRDDRTYFKWGFDLAWQALPWLTASLRYDRVILDMSDDYNSFRVITPRLIFHTHYFLDAQIRLQYSHYSYVSGCPTDKTCPTDPLVSHVMLRPGQVGPETRPDTDVFKIQAQFVF